MAYGSHFFRRAIAMILLHDLVEIDCGDHPIHLDHDAAAVEAAERAAACRLFGLLPDGARLLALWQGWRVPVAPEDVAGRFFTACRRGFRRR